MEKFTCVSCGQEFPKASGVELSIWARAAFFIATLGGLITSRVCPSCHSGVVGFGVVGLLIGVVVLMAVSIRWLAA